MPRSGHPGGFRRGVPILSVALAALAVACDQDRPVLVLEPAEAFATDRVTISGVPDTAAPSVARFTAPGGDWEDWWVEMALESGEHGGVRVQLPPHPSGLGVGGRLELRLAGLDHEPATVEVRPVPPAPGATREYVARTARALQEIVEGWGVPASGAIAAFHEDPSSLPPQLFFPVLGLHLLADPAHENSLLRILDGSAPILGGEPLELDAVDRLAGLRGLSDASASVAAARPAVPRPGVRFATGGSPVAPVTPWPRQQSSPSTLPLPRTGKVEIHTPGALDYWMRKRAELERRYGGLQGKVRNDIAGLLDWVPHGGAAVLVIANNSFEWALRSNLALLPSILDRLRLEAHPTEFDEDDERVGAWTATVVARSEVLRFSYGDLVDAAGGAWEVGKFAKGTAGAAKGVLRGSTAAASSRGAEIGEYAVQRAADKSKDWIGAEIQVLGPFEWGPIDLSAKDWTTARIGSRAAEGCVRTVNLQRSYVPQRVGECRLIVETRGEGGRFGGVFAHGDQGLSVKAIDVSVEPDGREVAPGAQVEFVARVRNAQRTTVEWSPPSRGSGQVLPGNRFRWTAPPLDPGTCRSPFAVEAEANTARGLRETREPRRYGTAHVMVRHPDGLRIRPEVLRLRPEADATLSALFAGGSARELNEPVTWQAESGDIRSTGPAEATYTAPDREGEFTVSASGRGPGGGECGDEATVIVRGSFCSWSANVGGRSLEGRPGDAAGFLAQPGAIQISLGQAGGNGVTLIVEGAGRDALGALEGGVLGNLGVSGSLTYGSFGPPKLPFTVWITENTSNVVVGRASGTALQLDYSTSPPRQSRIQFSASFIVEDQKDVRSETLQGIMSGDFTGAMQRLPVPGLGTGARGGQIQEQMQQLERLGGLPLAELGFTTMMCEVR